ncbi:Serine-threonine protein kinase 19, partial [Globisporangium splendens]
MLRRNQKRRRMAADAAAAAEDAAANEDEEDWGASAALVDDTLSALQLFATRSAVGFAATELPPIVLWHQLCVLRLHLLNDLPAFIAVLYAWVHRLRDGGALVTFRISTGTEDVAVLRTSDYVAELEKWLLMFRSQRERCGSDTTSATIASKKHDALARFIRIVPTICRLASISFNVLYEELSLLHHAPGADNDDAAEEAVWSDITWVQRLGFLRGSVDLVEDIFHFSVPGVGNLITAVKKTRATLLTALKRAKYKEIAEAQIKKHRLKHSRFDWNFHLADMEGAGIIRRTKVTSGTLVTLASK